MGIRLHSVVRSLVLIILPIAALLLFYHVPGGRAAGMVVNSPTDDPDSAPGDGSCDYDLALGGDQCSLRAAIEEANALPGYDSITFEIPSSGKQTITPGTGLPPIADPVTIDGTTQPGYTDTPLIEIAGTALATPHTTSGIEILVGNVNISGIAVRAFYQGVTMSNGDGNSLEWLVITDSTSHGVVIASGTQNTVWLRSSHGNGGLAIDLGGDGVTPNDAGDGDSGPNNLLNFPIIDNAVDNGSGLVEISGSMMSVPNSSYILAFYGSATCDPSGHGEGEHEIGSASVTTDAAGEAGFTLFALSIPGDTVVSAVAIDTNGNTSEFSACAAISTGDSTPTVVDAGPDRDGEEGELLTFDFTASNLDVAAEATIDWGDGSVQSQTVQPQSDDIVITAEHTYVNDGSYLLIVTVDDGTQAWSDEALVTIANRPPVISLSADPTVDEGATYAVEASVTDPGVQDPLSCSLDWGDGSGEDCFAGTQQYTHFYGDDGDYTVAFSAGDDAGATFILSRTVTAHNVAPDVSFTISPDQPRAGEDALLSGSISDPGALDSHAVTVDWGDGSPLQATTLPAGLEVFELSHRWDLAGSYAVEVCVEDDDGGGDCDVADIDVVADDLDDLIADAGGPYTVSGCRQPVTFDGSGSQAGSPNDTIVLYDWDLGDGTQVQSSEATITHSYVNSGLLILRLTVTDNHGSIASDAIRIEVPHAQPVVNAAGPYEGDEGSAITFNGSSSGCGNTFTNSWDFGDGSPVLTGTDLTSPQHTYADDGDYTVVVTVGDESGAEGSGTALVTVHNVAPTVGEITAPLEPVLAGTEVSAAALFDDAGALDTHSAHWDWGDGTTSDGTVSAVAGSGSVTGSHTYLEAGIYPIALRVTDDDGDSGQALFEHVVVYDPEGGFVTGGGWFDSPPGACDDFCKFATGRVDLGFVSRYNGIRTSRGAQPPIGNTDFDFSAGGLSFRSDEYKWLVVTGSGYATFEGTGTINGEADPNGQPYRFQLWAGDGTGSAGQDTLRMKIWYEDDGLEVLVYDNGMDQAIGGGSITVHE